MLFLNAACATTGADIVPVREYAIETAERPAKYVAYVTSWSVYARGFRMRDIPAEKFTHLIYAFAQIGPDGSIELFDPNADVAKSFGPEPGGLDFKGNFSQLIALKRAFPHLKTMISVGGWTRSSAYSAAAADPEKRSRFVASVMAFTEKYGFDGVDLDWEYPVEGGASSNERRPGDGENFLQLVRELRSAGAGRDKSVGGHFLVSMAISPNPKYLAHLDLQAFSGLCDFLNLMAYNYAGSAAAAHQAPLYLPGDAMSVSGSIRACLDAGVEADKLVVGIPAFGRGLTLPETAADAVLGVKVSGPAPKGTWESGSYDYRHIEHGIDMQRIALVTAAGKFWDDDAQAPYLYSADTGVFISYDDTRSVQAKSAVVKQLGLGGVMFWELSADPAGELADAASVVLGSPELVRP